MAGDATQTEEETKIYKIKTNPQGTYEVWKIGFFRDRYIRTYGTYEEAERAIAYAV